VRTLIRAYPTSLPRTGEVSIDLPVLFLTFAVSTLTGVLFGLIPSAHNRLSSAVTALKDGGDRGGRRLRHRLRRVLVTSEVALAVILVIGAGLLVRTVYNLATVDAGFDRAPLVTFSLTLPQQQANVRTRTYERLLERLQSAPGVNAVAAMSGLPPNRASNGRGTTFENHTGPTGSPMEIVDYYQVVIGDYFTTMGIPIVEGRGFEPADAGANRRVAVVNETLARAIWSGRTPIGRRLRPGGAAADVWFTVVGVAKDVKQGGVDQTTGSELYLIADQQGGAPQTMNLVLRTALPPTSLRATVEGILHDVDRSVPMVRFRAMDEVFADSIRRPRLLAQLLAAFAGLALLLAAVGTYGVLSYLVAERRREIGVRMALGASRAAVVRQVMTEGIRLTLFGLGLGLAGAAALSRFMTTLLFGVAPADPLTLGAVVPTIALIAGIACALPAWRASRLDPALVFRDSQ
jgi:predicted permease